MEISDSLWQSLKSDKPKGKERRRWCNPGHFTVMEQRCTKNIKPLAVSTRPYHLVREFSHVIVFTSQKQPASTISPLSLSCRQHNHSPSLLSLGTSTMPHSLPTSPTSPNMLTAIKGTIKHWKTGKLGQALLPAGFRTDEALWREDKTS